MPEHAERHAVDPEVSTTTSATAGPVPPDGTGLGATVIDLLGAAEAVEAPCLVRVGLAAGVDGTVQDDIGELLRRAGPVVGAAPCTDAGSDGACVDVLLDAGDGHAAIASALADVDGVEGVRVATVRGREESVGGGPENAERPDGGVVAAPGGRMPAAATPSYRESADAGDEELRLRWRLAAVEDRFDRLEADLSSEVEAVRAAVADAADEEDLAALGRRVEADTRRAMEHVFEPGSRRFDDPEQHHDSMREVVAAFDEEVRTTRALREAGPLGRLRWLLTGAVPEG